MKRLDMSDVVRGVTRAHTKAEKQFVRGLGKDECGLILYPDANTAKKRYSSLQKFLRESAPLFDADVSGVSICVRRKG